MFIEFIISARRFQQRLVCGYEYVKLQGWDLPVDRILFRRLSQFLSFFFFFKRELSAMHMNKLLHNEGTEYPGVENLHIRAAKLQQPF